MNRTGRRTNDPKPLMLTLRLNGDMKEWAEYKANLEDISVSGYIRELIQLDMVSNTVSPFNPVT